MSRWTNFVNGGKKEDESNRPLLPDSPAPGPYQSYSNASAPPMVPTQASTSSHDDFPEPVKPSAAAQHGQQEAHQCCEHALPQQVQHHSHQEQQAHAPPVYASGTMADGYPVMPHATQPPAYNPPLLVNSELIVLEARKGYPVVVACPHCGHTGPAAVSKESGFVTFFSSFLLCFVGCCILSLFPFCSDCTKDWVYRCARCGTLFGRERP